jgi:hypothetical protein
MRGRKLIKDQSSRLDLIESPVAAELDAYTHDFSGRTSFAIFSKSVVATQRVRWGLLFAMISWYNVRECHIII